MNNQLNELREKMIHETEAFLDQGLQPDSQAPKATQASSTSAPQPPPQDRSDDRPYFFPTWHEWMPASQTSSP